MFVAPLFASYCDDLRVGVKFGAFVDVLCELVSLFVFVSSRCFGMLGKC